MVDKSTKSLQVKPAQRGGKKSRVKGNRVERIVVDLMQASGFAAERVPLSGAAGGRFGADISVPLLGFDRRVEVKCRAGGFAQNYKWLTNNYALVVKRDRDEPLVVMRLSDALAVAIAAEKSRGGDDERLP